MVLDQIEAALDWKPEDDQQDHDVRRAEMVDCSVAETYWRPLTEKELQTLDGMFANIETDMTTRVRFFKLMRLYAGRLWGTVRKELIE